MIYVGNALMRSGSREI